jgi:hypothetical protein
MKKMSSPHHPSSAYQVKTDGTHTNTGKYYSFNGTIIPELRKSPMFGN